MKNLNRQNLAKRNNLKGKMISGSFFQKNLILNIFHQNLAIAIVSN
jgi:hypothetical protein